MKTLADFKRDAASGKILDNQVRGNAILKYNVYEQ